MVPDIVPEEEPDGAPAGKQGGDGRRRRARVWLAGAGAVVVAVVLAVLVGSGDGPDGSPPAVKGGGPAPSFELADVRQDEPSVSLPSFRGKPVVLNFWASWCVPCRREMPVFQAVADQFEGRVAFVGVNHQDSRRLALELLSETGVRYPSAYDPDGKVANAYRLFGMPTTVFISPQGSIVERRTGEMSGPELERAVERLLRA